MTRVAVLHGYSADNHGDGYLVCETLDLLTAADGTPADVTLLALRPESFTDLDGVRLVGPSTPGPWVRALRDVAAGRFDLVVGVGGGYLRFGTWTESFKTSVVHLPQLWAASRSPSRTVYLPQSVGPLSAPFRPLVRRLLRGVDVLHLRDDRSTAEVALPSSVRSLDLATADVLRSRRPRQQVSPVPVLTVRAVGGEVPRPVRDLAGLLRPFDGYVQSETGGNRDAVAVASLAPRTTLPRAELLGDGGTARVVVAVRLHAALLALRAGHYVVHLAYERKGFGAFEDLGLPEYVLPVRRFSPSGAAALTRALVEDADVRAEYDRRIEQRRGLGERQHAELAAFLQPATSGR